MNCLRLRRAIGAALITGLIVGMFLTPHPAAASDTQTYTNSLVGFSITAPVEWRISETGRRISFVEIKPPGFTNLVSIQLSVLRHAGPDTLPDWMDWQVSNYGRRFVEIHDETPVRLGPDTDGFRTVFVWHNELGIKEGWTGVLRGRQSFVIRAFGTVSEYDRLRDTLDEIVSSFTLLPPDPTQAHSDDVFALVGEEPDTLDPTLHTGPVTGPLNAIFGGLVRMDEDLNVIPDIARDWDVSADGEVYTFNLRYNAYFHNGDWVTTEDIVYSWERATDPEVGSSTARAYLGDISGVREKLAGEADEISGIEALDLFTLRVTLTSPRSTFIQKLTHPVASVVDRSNVEDGNLAERPRGTGPYKLVHWIRGGGLVLERSHRFHLEQPNMLAVVYRYGAADPQELYSSKQIDTVPVPYAHFDRARNTSGDLYPDLVSSPTFCTSFLAFDSNVPPFDDVSVRRAFTHALDVDKIISVVLRGTVDRARTLVPPGVSGHHEDLPASQFDLEAARALIAESSEGLANRNPIPAAVHNSTMIWMWREYLGMDVRVHTGSSDDRAGVWTGTWCPDYLDAENYLETHLHTDGPQNRFGFSNNEVDTLLDEAATISAPAQRAEAYKRIESIARDHWIVVPLWHERRHELVQQYVVGYRPAMTEISFFKDIYFER